MNFLITALGHESFESMFKLSDKELSELGGMKMIVDEKPGFPCRVSLEDANIGEEVILVPFEHHKTNSPYQAKGPIFVRKGQKQRKLEVNEIPKMLEHRLLSFRGYDNDGIMKSAKTESGKDSLRIIREIFGEKSIEYIQIHNSSPGCYNCQVNRI